MNLKKTSLLIALACVFLSGEAFAKKIVEASEDTKRHTLTKQRAVRTSKVTQKKSPQLVQSTKRVKRKLPAPSTDTKRSTPKRSVLVRKKVTIATPSRKRIAGRNTIVRKKATLPQKITPPVVATPVNTLTIDQNEALSNSFAQLSKARDSLNLVLRKNDEEIEKLRLETQKLKLGCDRLELSNKKINILLNTPGFKEKLRVHFNKLNAKQKEEFRSVFRNSSANSAKQ